MTKLDTKEILAFAKSALYMDDISKKMTKIERKFFENYLELCNAYDEAQKEIERLRECLENYEHEAEMQRKRDECIGRNL